MSAIQSAKAIPAEPKKRIDFIDILRGMAGYIDPVFHWYGCLAIGLYQWKSWYRHYLIVAIAGIALGLLITYFDLELQYNSRFNEISITKGSVAELYQIRPVAQTMGYLSLLVLVTAEPDLGKEGSFQEIKAEANIKIS